MIGTRSQRNTILNESLVLCFSDLCEENIVKTVLLTIAELLHFHVLRDKVKTYSMHFIAVVESNHTIT